MEYRNYVIKITLVGKTGLKACTAEVKDSGTGWEYGCTEILKKDAVESCKKAIDIFLDR